MSSHVSFDEGVAADYDDAVAEMFAPEVLEPTIDVLAELAGGAAALEFAVGTGRVALPLHERGVDVSGIEVSSAMVDQMMAKPGAECVPVTVGDMASTRVVGTFGLVYLVFNTISNLLTQDRQVACFRNAATHLEVGGCFLVETFVPALRRLPPGETLVAFDASATHAGVDEYDVADQTLVSHHYWTGRREVHRFESRHRYAWPAEYDLMARIAGMWLRHRWSDWHRSAFTSESTTHVSVWEKLGDAGRRESVSASR
jgi:hypothetical protein